MTMLLEKRPSIYELPSYSLTSDLLGYLRCGLQYRYTRLGHLPSTRPVQLWFGQFIHGVLEEAYREFNEARKAGRDDVPPWPAERIAELCERIKRRLAARRLFPYDERLEQIGEARAHAAINDLGPELFPLIHRAEIRLRGSRPLPTTGIPKEFRFRTADRYEVAGVIDVITHVELADPRFRENRIVRAVLAALAGEPPASFEVVIDYKGMRRPPVQSPVQPGPSLWEIYSWQVQTYAFLRHRQPDSLPVAAGMILYVNELSPTRSDLQKLRQEIRSGTTDIAPDPGTDIERVLTQWNPRDPRQPLPALPLEFRLSRAVRVIPVTRASVTEALERFDDVVARIETCRGRELSHGRIISSWDKDASDDSTCTACDARTFCPENTRHNRPRLPGVKRTRPTEEESDTVQAW
jgi:hypothetical protein